MSLISPKVDIAFKKIFGVEENKDLLISLINSIVSKEDQVIDVTLLNPYNSKNFKKEKLSILDIKAKSEDGKRFNIEIQLSDEADYDKRALFYWGKLYTEQLESATDYSTLSKTIGIHILNFISIPENSDYHNFFVLTNPKNGAKFFTDIELHTIELKKFAGNPNEELSDLVAKIKTALDIWVAFLTRNDLLNKNNLPKELDNANLKKALTVLDIMNFTEEERASYEDHLKWLRMETNTLKKSEQRSKAEGIVEGKKARNLEIALNMLKKKMSLADIAELTGLSIKELNKLVPK